MPENALDRLTIDQFARKPVALLSHGGAPSAVQACDHLRIVMRGLYALAIPDQGVTTPADFEVVGDGYILSSAGAWSRITRACAELLRLARLLTREEART